MDASGLVSGLILAASLLTFAYLSLGEKLLNVPGRRPPPSLPLDILLLASPVAAAISAVALFLSLSWMTWPLATLLSFALLVSLLALTWGTKYLATNHRSITLPLVSPLRRVINLSPAATQSSRLERVAPSREAGEEARTLQEAEPNIAAEEHANLDERERSMIRSILRLDEFNARDILVPRVDIVAVDVEESLADVGKRMLESGHSRLPVYRETIDNVVGVIYARDLLPLLNMEEPWPTVEKLLRQPFFIPETKRLDELLPEFQRLRVHMAMVVDEHGGIEGLVTLEDLLEEIVGEIEDEFSTTAEPQITPTANGDLIVDAKTSLNNLEELVPLKFDEAEVDTIGGLVYSMLGKMPQAGDEVVYDGLRIRVLSTLGRRLRKLKLTPERRED